MTVERERVCVCVCVSVCVCVCVRELIENCYKVRMYVHVQDTNGIKHNLLTLSLTS